MANLVSKLQNTRFHEMKVVLISSIVPGNAGSGNLVLYRHFTEAREIELLVVSDGPVPGFEHVVLQHRISSRIFKRIAKTYLRLWGLDFQEFFLPCNPNRVAEICRGFKPDAIMTVGHGNLWRLALREARSSRVPLVTIFHDWWPDLSGTHEILRPLVDKKVRALHQNSTVSLCVCQGMSAALGPHRRAEVLYPLPGGCPPLVSPGAQLLSGLGGLKVVYMGNLGDYGAMVQTALEAMKNHPRIRLEVGGRCPAWPASFRIEMQERGLWHGFVPQEELSNWLVRADAFLVAMRFESHSRRFMETSFPSKLTHYAQFHKPIVIWGPDYCSAVRWARERGSALCVTDPSPLALVRALETLNPAERERWAAKAREAANNDFNPDKIQKQFLDAIEHAVKKTATPQSDRAWGKALLPHNVNP
jgi:glycosyltransferase involved in cell wall biosynthesis